MKLVHCRWQCQTVANKNYIISMGGKKHEQKNRKRSSLWSMILGSAVPAMAGTADGKKIALVGKSAGNAFFEIAADSFVETAEADGDYW